LWCIVYFRVTAGFSKRRGVRGNLPLPTPPSRRAWRAYRRLHRLLCVLLLYFIRLVYDIVKWRLFMCCVLVRVSTWYCQTFVSVRSVNDSRRSRCDCKRRFYLCWINTVNKTTFTIALLHRGRNDNFNNLKLTIVMFEKRWQVIRAKLTWRATSSVLPPEQSVHSLQ